MIDLSLNAVVAWNPINVIEGEGHWVSQVALISVAMSLITVILYSIKLNFLRREKKNSTDSFEADEALPKYRFGWCNKISAFFSSRIAATIFDAFYRPLIVLIWYSASIYCINIVTDGLISHIFQLSYSIIEKIGLIFAFGWVLFRLKNGLISLIAQKEMIFLSDIEPSTLQALSKLTTIAIIIFMFVVFHDVTGMSMTTVLAFGGVGGLAAAFASQDIVANFFGGMMIHIVRPFSVGESIVIPSIQLDGTVEELGWYQTTVRSIDKTALYIPNSTITKAMVVNKSRMTHRLINDSLYIKVAPDKLKLLMDDLRQTAARENGIDVHQGISIWVASFYGPVVKISLYLYVSTTNYASYCRVRESLFVAFANSVQRHEGVFTPPAEMNDTWMHIAAN